MRAENACDSKKSFALLDYEADHSRRVSKMRVNPGSSAIGANMLIDACRARLRLDKGNHASLERACGTRLTAVSGIAWITVDRDAGDNLIGPGESFVVRSTRPVLIGPLFASVTLDVQVARDIVECAARSRPGFATKLLSLLGLERRLAQGAPS